MSTSGTSIFTGSSRFSNDFQQVITRAVAIASLPITQLQNEVTTLQSQSSSLTALQTGFASLQSSLTSLESALGTGSFTATASDSDVASVGITGTPLAGAFSIEVTGSGTCSSSMSKDGLPVIADIAKSTLGAATSYTLQVGTKPFTIAPASQTLSALADSINANLDAGVQANIVNFGSTAAPDYRLSITGTKYGDFPIQLRADDGINQNQDLLSSGNTGAPVSYRVNGKPDTALTSDSRIITPAPGVTVTLLGEGTTTITVGRTAATVSAALASFAKAYNSVRSELDKNHGTSGGALQGQSILNTASDALHQIAAYSTGSAAISSLTQLGLTFDKNGVMSFDSLAFSEASKDQFSALSNFLGASKTGGFLKSATDTLNVLAASDTGVLAQNIDLVQGQIARTNAAIETRQDRVDALETKMQAQMAAADAAIAALEQQAAYFTNMFTAMEDAQRNNG